MSNLGFTHKYVPPRARSSRTLLLLHRRGGDENDLLTLGEELAPEAGLLSPRVDLLGEGNALPSRRSSDGGYDLAELHHRTDGLADFVRGASLEYGFDRDQVIAVGYLDGADLASSLLIRHPSLLVGVVLLHGRVAFTPGTLPDLSGKGVFIGAGENDTIVSRAETRRLADMLSKAGADVRLEWFTAGHYLSAPEVRAASLWLSSLENVCRPSQAAVGRGLMGLLLPNQQGRLRRPMLSGYQK